MKTCNLRVGLACKRLIGGGNAAGSEEHLFINNPDPSLFELIVLSNAEEVV